MPTSARFLSWGFSRARVWPDPRPRASSSHAGVRGPGAPHSAATASAIAVAASRARSLRRAQNAPTQPQAMQPGHRRRKRWARPRPAVRAGRRTRPAASARPRRDTDSRARTTGDVRGPRSARARRGRPRCVRSHHRRAGSRAWPCRGHGSRSRARRRGGPTRCAPHRGVARRARCRGRRRAGPRRDPWSSPGDPGARNPVDIGDRSPQHTRTRTAPRRVPAAQIVACSLPRTGRYDPHERLPYRTPVATVARDRDRPLAGADAVRARDARPVRALPLAVQGVSAQHGAPGRTAPVAPRSADPHGGDNNSQSPQ
jgi:hypothetical protein